MVSVIKSVSVGLGDMYYIRHGSDNLTMIDCMLPEDQAWRRRIMDELVDASDGKTIKRFISTHPDQDHVQGLEYLDSRMKILNFYCVKNAATKEDPTSDFEYYCSLRDDPKKAFYIYKGCSRRWMNESSDERGSPGINILWPDTSNIHFKAALADAEEGKSPNNTSAIIKYTLNNGVTALWMGDLETAFMEEINGHVDLPDVDLLFAPHHGRKSGRLPANWLQAMDPTVIVLGEAPSEELYYYPGRTMITQNKTGDIAFDCVQGWVHIYVSNEGYYHKKLEDRSVTSDLGHYVGSFRV